MGFLAKIVFIERVSNLIWLDKWIQGGVIWHLTEVISRN